MSRNGGLPAEHELTELAKRFHHWRHTRATARERIPQALWEQAVAVSRVLPISHVARALRLSPGELKKRRTAAWDTRPTPSTPAALAFMTWGVATTDEKGEAERYAVGGHCGPEVESPWCREPVR